MLSRYLQQIEAGFSGGRLQIEARLSEELEDLPIRVDQNSVRRVPVLNSLTDSPL